MLLSLKISDFRGIAEFHAEPNGKSLTLRGPNGAGKSSAIDALWWALGGALDGETVRNGAERAEVEVRFGEYLVTRKQTRGKRPSLTVKSADGKASFASPTALLAGFAAAIERRTFSALPTKEQAAILRKLAPGLDVSDLDAEREKVYAERTEINRAAAQYQAQADGVTVPPDVEVPAERSAAEIAGRLADAVEARQKRAATLDAGKAHAERIEARKRELDALRAQQEAAAELPAKARAQIEAQREAREALEAAAAEVARLEALLATARAAYAAQTRIVDRLPEIDLAEAEAAPARLADEIAEKSAALAADEAALAVAREAFAALPNPDPEAIRAELATVEAHNAEARRLAAAHAEHVRATKQRADLAAEATRRKAASAALTARIDAIDEEKAARTAAAKLPITGLALSGDAVTLDDGTHGPVEIAALNTATRIRLDVAIGAALGHRIVAVRDASMLDGAGRAALEAFAHEHGVQLISEIVSDGKQLEAVIEDGGNEEAQPDLF